MCTKICIQRFIRDCLWEQHLEVEEGNRNGLSLEKLNCYVVAKQTSINPTSALHWAGHSEVSSVEVEETSMLYPASILKHVHLFGCIWSQLWHSGSSLQHVGSFVVAHTTLLLWCRGPVAPRHGDLCFQTRDQTWDPCTAWWILNHWTPREIPGGCLPMFFSFR